jgi:hypothetical protein
MTGIALALYFLLFVVLGNIDVSGIFPTEKIAKTILEVWPRMPFFAVQRETVNGGKDQEIYYTVPTRQLTRQEIARLEATNGVMHPAAPK